MSWFGPKYGYNDGPPSPAVSPAMKSSVRDPSAPAPPRPAAVGGADLPDEARQTINLKSRASQLLIVIGGDFPRFKSQHMVSVLADVHGAVGIRLQGPPCSQTSGLSERYFRVYPETTLTEALEFAESAEREWLEWAAEQHAAKVAPQRAEWMALAMALAGNENATLHGNWKELCKAVDAIIDHADKRFAAKDKP